MKTSDIAKKILSIHQYRLYEAPWYWSRVGTICKRYGIEVVEEAVEAVPPKEIPLIDMLNIIESKCQHILEYGDLDELSNELLNS